MLINRPCCAVWWIALEVCQVRLSHSLDQRGEALAKTCLYAERMS